MTTPAEFHQRAPKAHSRIQVPFTASQVRSLNDYQTEAHMHPFTCGQDSAHGSLVATADGWFCPAECGYTQDWAHAFMADDTWREWRTNTDWLLNLVEQAKKSSS